MTKYEFDDLACIDDDFACRDDDFACIDDDWACIDDDDAVCDDERDNTLIFDNHAACVFYVAQRV